MTDMLVAKILTTRSAACHEVLLNASGSLGHASNGTSFLGHKCSPYDGRCVLWGACGIGKAGEAKTKKVQVSRSDLGSILWQLAGSHILQGETETGWQVS